MEGFFSNKETESKSRPDGKLYTCTSCGLYKSCQTPRMKPYGNFKKGILNVGKLVSKAEDERGIPWVGSAGRMLKQAYKDVGIDLYDDCLNVNAISCHTDSDTINLAYHVPCCRNRVLEVIKEYQPKVIVLFGAQAIESVIGHRWKKDLNNVNKWRGWSIPDKKYKTWVCPTFHPTFMEENKKEVVTIWDQDLQNIKEHVDIPFPRFKEPHIEYIEDLSILNSIDTDLIAFDYEATGIKPHAPGHRIICAAVAISPDYVYTFLMPNTKKGRKPFTDLLANPKIGKIAQNLKYEDTWSLVKLKLQINNWAFDPMLASHIFDNRPGITGLKFQAFINFGAISYDDSIAPYLKGSRKDGNSINTIHKLLETDEGTKELLKYCALDAHYTYNLAMKQIDEINYDFLPF